MCAQNMAMVLVMYDHVCKYFKKTVILKWFKMNTYFYLFVFSPWGYSLASKFEALICIMVIWRNNYCKALLFIILGNEHGKTAFL